MVNDESIYKVKKKAKTKKAPSNSANRRRGGSEDFDANDESVRFKNTYVTERPVRVSKPRASKEAAKATIKEALKTVTAEINDDGTGPTLEEVDSLDVEDEFDEVIQYDE